MTITYDKAVDATNIGVASGTPYLSVPLERGGVLSSWTSTGRAGC